MTEVRDRTEEAKRDLILRDTELDLDRRRNVLRDTEMEPLRGPTDGMCGYKGVRRTELRTKRKGDVGSETTI